jgi:hypothetical protein
MGTNYYLFEKPDCKCCGRPFEPLHIGKSSGGWCFSLHVIPDYRINDLDDWRELWSKEGTIIRNEYDEAISVAEMEDIITNRSWAKIPSEGDQWYRQNQAKRGPNNLARHCVNGSNCIKNGAGTWDCITGDFS